MKLGYFGIGSGPCADPDAAVRVAGAAEDAGFESLWTGEHVVLPDPQVPPSPVPPDTAMLDPVVALAFVAAATERVLLGTGIIIVPQRNPLVLAKQLASLDVLSGGPPALRRGRGLPAAGVRGARRSVRREGRAHRRVPGCDPGALDREEASL
ncbi:MAG: LLM class flavin-dependent oxidoreductase [Proteobacteria bacterium]|nr:LLM class flavin-dependent oxidoreductase [Pseudomonadota bacterium]